MTIDLGGSMVDDEILARVLQESPLCTVLLAVDCSCLSPLGLLGAAHALRASNVTRVCLRNTEIDAAAFFALWELARLAALDVSDCSNIVESHLYSARPAAATLRELSLARCCRVTA